MEEDNSFVSLSLNKYNELYDKAKKYDEMMKSNESNHIPTVDFNIPDDDDLPF